MACHGRLTRAHGPQRSSLSRLTTLPFHGAPLVLAALMRAMRPCSKRAWAIWAQQTSVHRRCDLPPAALTRPACRAQLEAVAGLAGEAIAADLTRKVIHDVQRQPATLCDDTAHCCTSLASGNERATLAQRAPKRGDLRPCSRAWRVTREGQLPRSADVSAGHTVEALRCPAAWTARRHRGEQHGGQRAARTLVYAQGNRAKANQALVDVLRGATSPHSSPASLRIHGDADDRLDAYRQRAVGQAPRVPLSTDYLGEAARTGGLLLSSTLRQGQIRGLHQDVHQWLDAL